MKPTSLFFVLMLFFASFSFGQNEPERILHFHIVADSSSVEGINVVNLVNEKTAISDKNGNFSMPAKLDDLLVLSSVQFEYKRKIIETDDLKKDVILIEMTPKVTQLDEVIITDYPNLNPEALGIVKKGQKQYTPAERHIYTATTGPVDIVANFISGRTKQLKKELEISKKESLMDKLEFLYEENYYVETLHIAPEFIKGFQYYLVENAEFVAALKANNKTMTMFIASRLAVEFNKLKSDSQ